MRLLKSEQVAGGKQGEWGIAIWQEGGSGDGEIHALWKPDVLKNDKDETVNIPLFGDLTDDWCSHSFAAIGLRKWNWEKRELVIWIGVIFETLVFLPISSLPCLPFPCRLSRKGYRNAGIKLSQENKHTNIQTIDFKSISKPLVQLTLACAIQHSERHTTVLFYKFS